MATYTSNYGWTKPSGSDNVDISVLNDNLDDQDSTIHDAFLNMAPPFSESSTYAVDDIVLYGTGLYKCHTAVVTPGSWTGSTNWQVYKLSEGGSGGGTSNYNDLSNKPSINSVTLSGNKTSADLGLQDAIQIDTMPTASATYDDKIVQYVGTTTASYTHGYYYECINNGGTYSWTQLNVQPSSGGGTSDYADLTNKPQINGVTLTGNKTTSDLGIDKNAVGLGNVPNVSTNDQEPTFTEASTRNNIASGEKLSVILGKIQKFFNDLKTVAFSGSYTDLTNTPTIPAAQVNSDWSASSGVAEILNKPSLATVATSGSYTDLTDKPNADDILMSDGVTSVEEAVDGLTEALTIGTVVTDGVATLDTWIVTDAPIESTGLYSVMYISNAGMRYQLILLGANLSTIQNPIGMTGNINQTNNILLAKEDGTNKLCMYVSSGVGTGAYYVAKLMDLLETV